MIRKTLTILSLIGLLLSMALCFVSEPRTDRLLQTRLRRLMFWYPCVRLRQRRKIGRDVFRSWRDAQ